MQPQVSKLLNGGLNLLAAGDALAEGQAIAAQNCRSDQAANLRGRKSRSAAIATPGGNVHSIASVLRVGGRTRYYGADTKLFRDGSSIATGFDGEPLGIVSFQDRAWVMNRAKQGKDDGTTFSDWTPAAPAAAPTGAIYASGTLAYVGGPGDTVTGKLSGPIVYCAVGIVPGIGEVARTLALITTSHSGTGGLKWGQVPDSSWVGFTDKAVNRVGPPVFADPAITEWNLYRVPIYKDPQQEPTSGAYNQIGYRVNQAPIAIANFYDDTGGQVFGGDDQRDCGMVKRNITLNPAFSLQGNFNYYVTGITDRAEETNPAPVLNATLACDGVKITRPALDPSLPKWNLYREGGPFNQPAYLMNDTPFDAAVTDFSDTGKDNTEFGGDDQSENGLAQRGIIMRKDRDVPPPARGLAGPYMGRLLAFNSADHPNRIWYTPALEPWNFPGSHSDQDGNWVDVGQDGEEVRAIAIFPRRVAIMTSAGYYRLVGDPQDWSSDVERTNAEAGQIGTAAWAVAGGFVFGQGLEGLYSFNGDVAEKITPALDPLFKQDAIITSGAQPNVSVHSDVSIRGNACMAYRNGRLYFSFPSANSAGPNDTTLLMENGRWFQDDRAFSALYDEGQDGYLLGAYGGAVYELETGTAEANIPIEWQSRYENQGSPENQKRYADVFIEHHTRGRVFTAYAYLDNGATVVNLGTFSSNAWTQTTLPLDDVEHRNISVRLECPLGNAPAEIYTVIVHYYPVERNARAYDTGRVGLEKVSLLGGLELELHILSGSVHYSFQSGITNLAEIAHGDIAGPGVLTKTVALPDNTDARWVRCELTGDNFRCGDIRVQLRPYGCYLAGVQDRYRSGDLTFGSPRPKLIQQLRIDCHPDADNSAGVLLADIATNTSLNFPLAQSSGRSWQRVTFPPNTQGLVSRLEITAWAALRLYAIQARVKVLGEAAGWQWVDVPVPPTPADLTWIHLPLK